jgi:hypothetical protein
MRKLVNIPKWLFIGILALLFPSFVHFFPRQRMRVGIFIFNSPPPLWDIHKFFRPLNPSASPSRCFFLAAQPNEKKRPMAKGKRRQKREFVKGEEGRGKDGLNIPKEAKKKAMKGKAKASPLALAHWHWRRALMPFKIDKRQCKIAILQNCFLDA